MMTVWGYEETWRMGAGCMAWRLLPVRMNWRDEGHAGPSCYPLGGVRCAFGKMRLAEELSVNDIN